MRSLLMKVCIAVFVFLGCIPAQEDTYTDKLVNGRLWKSLNSIAKVCYIQGYREGVLQVAIDSPSDEVARATAERFHGFTIKNGEIMGALDRFYEDPLNARIAIIDAMVIVLNQARGVGSQEIEHQVTALRRRLSAVDGRSEKK